MPEIDLYAVIVFYVIVGIPAGMIICLMFTGIFLGAGLDSRQDKSSG